MRNKVYLITCELSAGEVAWSATSRTIILAFAFLVCRLVREACRSSGGCEPGASPRPEVGRPRRNYLGCDLTAKERGEDNGGNRELSVERNSRSTKNGREVVEARGTRAGEEF
jgi:hypothetical protein